MTGGAIMTISLEKLVLANMFVFMALAFLFVILFTRISIKYINKQMLNDSVTPPLWDKGTGASTPLLCHGNIFQTLAITHTYF